MFDSGGLSAHIITFHHGILTVSIIISLCAFIITWLICWALGRALHYKAALSATIIIGLLVHTLLSWVLGFHPVSFEVVSVGYSVEGRD